VTQRARGHGLTAESLGKRLERSVPLWPQWLERWLSGAMQTHFVLDAQTGAERGNTRPSRCVSCLAIWLSMRTSLEGTKPQTGTRLAGCVRGAML
jgi:hypothetical protein